MQTTLKTEIAFTGQGLHSGAPVRMRIAPAPAGHGIVFTRSDVAPGTGQLPAHWDMADQTPLCTRLRNEHDVTLSTIEHVMAALAGCGVHNAAIRVDGPELPILDGSAAPFAQAILATGLRYMAAPLEAIEILAPVEVTRGDASARLEPSERPSMRFEIDFEDAAIGRQSKQMDLANGAFLRELSDSRTFCRLSDVEQMRAQGLALGGTFRNAVVVDGGHVLSPGGLRHADEAVRHKMLDALGDLALAGRPILGHYTGIRAGHALTNALLRKLFATPEAWRVVTCSPATEAMLPGTGARLSDLPDVA